MNWGLGNGLIIGVVAAALNAGQPPSLTVYVYDYAGLPSKVIRETETEAARIFRHAGIEMTWVDCPSMPTQQTEHPACDAPVGAATLCLRLLPQSMAQRYPSVQDSFGFALQPEDGSFGITANIFAVSAAQLAARRGMSHGVLLAHIAAHELGHLLLGAGGHSRAGIMHVPWHVPELSVISRGEMLFMPQQSERIRASVRARTGN